MFEQSGQRDPSLKQLRALLKLADNSYRSAADSSAERSSLWQAISRLEDFVNQARSVDDQPVQIVNEGGNGLTSAGATLWQYAAEVIQAVDAFNGAAGDAVRHTEKIRVGCYPSQIRAIALAASELGRDSEETVLDIVRVEDNSRLNEGKDLIDGVRKGTIDIAIIPRGDRLQHMSKDRLITEPLYSWKLLAVAEDGHWGTNAGQQIQMKSLRKESLFVSPIGHQTREIIDKCGLNLDFALETSSTEALVSLATLGLGIAIIAADSISVQRADPHDRAQWRPVRHYQKELGGSNVAIFRQTYWTEELSNRIIPQLIESISEAMTVPGLEFVAAHVN